jgi:hypothetical protein
VHFGRSFQMRPARAKWLFHTRLAQCGFAFRVDVQDDFCHFLPICPFSVGVEQAQIGDEMLLVVAPSNSCQQAQHQR